MNITVYTLPACVQCETTKRYLDKQNVSYSVVDISEDAEAHQRVMEAGFTAAPVVSVNDGEKMWSGFRLDKLQYLAYDVHKVATASA